MRRYSLFIFLFLLSLQGFSQTLTTEVVDTQTSGKFDHTAEIAIIPEPVSLVKTEGHFILPANVVIHSSAAPEIKQVVSFLQERLSIPTGSFVSNISDTKGAATIKLILNDKVNAAIGNEG